VILLLHTCNCVQLLGRCAKCHDQSVVRKICVHGVEDEMRGNARAVMLHYAVYLGVHTYRKCMSIACATTCTVFFILFHGIPGIKIVYMCIRDAQQREICERLLNDTQ
jgi:hypothetical protein